MVYETVVVVLQGLMKVFRHRVIAALVLGVAICPSARCDNYQDSNLHVRALLGCLNPAPSTSNVAALGCLLQRVRPLDLSGYACAQL